MHRSAPCVHERTCSPEHLGLGEQQSQEDEARHVPARTWTGTARIYLSLQKPEARDAKMRALVSDAIDSAHEGRASPVRSAAHFSAVNGFTSDRLSKLQDQFQSSQRALPKV